MSKSGCHADALDQHLCIADDPGPEALRWKPLVEERQSWVTASLAERYAPGPSHPGFDRAKPATELGRRSWRCLGPARAARARARQPRRSSSGADSAGGGVVGQPAGHEDDPDVRLGALHDCDILEVDPYIAFRFELCSEQVLDGLRHLKGLSPRSAGGGS